MAVEQMRRVRTLAPAGPEVTGGWAACALHFGIDAIAADVKPEMENWIRSGVANAEGASARLTSVTTQVLRVEGNGLHLSHSLKRSGDGRPIATSERLYEYASASGGAGAPRGAGLRAGRDASRDARAGLPDPPRAGCHMVFPGK